MRWTTKLSLGLLALFVGTIGLLNVVSAQTVELTNDQTIAIVIVGAVAGVVRAYIGYDKSPKDFDPAVFLSGALTSVLVSIPIALAAALTQTELNLYGLVLVFFATIGATWATLKSREKTVPSLEE